MPTLVIHAPRRTTNAQGKKSFDGVMSTRIGEGYAIARGLVDQCPADCRVVLLSKDERKRAEGTLVKLVPVGKANNGLVRYDVYIKDLKTVSYQPERLNRNGVGVIRT